MTLFKLCGVAMAAFLVSTLPAVAQDDGMTTAEPDDGMMHTMEGDEESGDIAGNGFVTFEFDDEMFRLPIGIAAQFCETTASELAQGMRGEIECDISEEEARRIRFPGFTGDGMTDDDDMTEEQREERRQMREQEREDRAGERDEQRDAREDEREMRQEEREKDKDQEEEEP